MMVSRIHCLQVLVTEAHTIVADPQMQQQVGRRMGLLRCALFDAAAWCLSACLAAWTAMRAATWQCRAICSALHCVAPRVIVLQRMCTGG